MSREPGDGDLLGKDLADAAYSVLARGDRQPASFARIAEWLVQRGRLSGSPEALAPTVAAALRADAARARRSHTRERFRIHEQRVGLIEWLVPREAIRTEENVERSAEQQRDQVRRAFAGRLNELPAAGFAELIATWLNAEGVTSLRAVRRPGSSGREFHFAGTLRRGAEENRLAFVVVRAGRDVDREIVVDARGSLQHYGNATGAWVVTTGRIAGAAHEEGSSQGAAPCALFSGHDLARSMEQLGIGIKQHFVALCDIDFELLESLGDAGSTRRERDDRPRFDRDRGRGPREQEPREGYEPDGREPPAEGEAEPKKEFDLLDPAVAEESRLVAPSSGWEPSEDAEGEGDEQTTEPGDEDELAAAPPSSVPGDEDDDESTGNELELDASDADEDEAHDEEADRS